MSSAQSPQRYPKRKRPKVSYKYFEDSDELGEDIDDKALVIKEDPDDEVDWKTAVNKASKSKALKKQYRRAVKRSIFPFMKLPAELRNTIYTHCLQTPGGVNLTLHNIMPHCSRRRLIQGMSVKGMSGFDPTSRYYFSQHSICNLALLRVSKEIYEEAVDFVYTQEFRFKTLPAMWNFLQALSPETKGLLRYLEVKPTESEWNFLPAISAELPIQGKNLERIHIHGLARHVGLASPIKHLKSSDRALESWPKSVDSLDKILGIVLANATYDYMFPFVTKFVRERGVEKLVKVLNPFKTKPPLDYRFYTSVEATFPMSVSTQPWSKARASRARTSMAEELSLLIALDAPVQILRNGGHKMEESS